MLRESYYFTMAQGGDSMSFAAFAESLRVYPEGDSLYRALWKFERVMFLATLGRLGYGVGPQDWKYGVRERTALERFQADLGLPRTGRLDSATVVMLVRAEKALDKPAIGLPPFGFYNTGRWLSAHGTWKAMTNKMAYPVNTVDIQCDAATGVCEEVSVSITSDNLDYVDRVRRTTYHITQWTDLQLVAVGEELPGSDCHATLTIHIPTQEVMVRQWCASADTLGPFVRGPYEMTLKLVNGMWLNVPSMDKDLREVHAELFAERDTFIAIRQRNMQRGAAK